MLSWIDAARDLALGLLPNRVSVHGFMLLNLKHKLPVDKTIAIWKLVIVRIEEWSHWVRKRHLIIKNIIRMDETKCDQEI